MPRIRVIFLLASVCCTCLLFLACGEGKQIPAVGPGYEVVVLHSRETAALAGAVDTILKREIRLVHEEPSFETALDVLEEYSFYDTRKILFVVALPEDPTLSKILRRSTGVRTRTSFPGLWIVTEPFAAGQILFLLTGPADALRDALVKRSGELLEIVEEAAVTLQLTNMFRGGEQPGARDAMRQRWGWGVRLHPQWVVDDRFADRRFVRVWRDAPVAQLFVSWEKGQVERTPVEWLWRRHQLVQRFYDEDLVAFDRSDVVEGPTPFGIDGVELDGVWENEKYVIGGPFHSFAFYCAEDDRTYLVDMSAYAPGKSKRPLMRRLEAVLRTFRCGCVPAPTKGDAT